MKKLLRILGCSKRKTTSLTKTASCTGNNVSSRSEQVDNSISMQKKGDNEMNKDNHNDYDYDLDTDHHHNHQDEIIIKQYKDKDKPIEPLEPQQQQSNIDEEDQWLIPKDSPFITDYEKGIIDFSPNGLGKFVETINQLPGYKTLYNKQGIQIDINMSGSPITSDFGLVKTVYKQKKSELGSNASIANILRLMFRAEDRAKWDTVLKLVKRYEGNDKVFIIRTWAISFPLISEREGIEKRMIFNYKGIPHVFSTSVRPDYIPEEKDVVRIVNYLDIFQIFEDEEYYYFTTFTQSDFKMPIPQFLMNLFLPKTSLDWFIKFQKVAAQTVLDPL